MRSEALDIVIEGRGTATWLILSGPFNKEQIPNIREKFAALLEDNNRHFVADLERVAAIDDAAVQMFLTVLSEVRGKGGEIRFIFKNQTVASAFAPYQQLCQIFPDQAALAAAGGIFGRFMRRSSVLSKKTGIRISRPVAIFLCIVLCGWFVSLLFIIHLQNQHLAEQQKELDELTQWKQHSLIEINTLKERVRPLEQLGILRDTLKE